MLTFFRVTILVLLSAALAFPAHKPRLIVVISLDQFRSDYLNRFEPHFGKNGFRMLTTQGAHFANASFKHALTLTGPGHAVIGTGAYGAQNGIIANGWYDRRAHKDVYCVADPSVLPVGIPHGSSSPHLLASSTFGDELRLTTAFRSKVITASQKDRSAILMGGKLANAAYWIVDSLFGTSSYYVRELPGWVKSFNASGLVNSYFGRTWDRILPVEAYAGLDRDDAPYEGDWNGVGRTFPHVIRGEDASHITHSYFRAFETSPFSNEVLAVFAMQAITAESLGMRGVTDVLCIGFAGSDIVGHTFGPNSHEVLDLVVRMDQLLTEFFGFLDEKIGLRNCVIVLTADHGVSPIPEETSNGRPVGLRLPDGTVRTSAERILGNFTGRRTGSPWIEKLTSGNIYLNRPLLGQQGIDLEEAAAVLADSLRSLPEVEYAFSRNELMELSPATPIERRMRNSFRPDRSGDVMFALPPFTLEGEGPAGTTHGSPYEYDAAVPLVIFGEGIRPGTCYGEASPADIAPTISALLGIVPPSGSQGRVLKEALEK
jgi:predicted AlkP superfamily pyrophosphatase or phosphodiesterase